MLHRARSLASLATLAIFVLSLAACGDDGPTTDGGSDGGSRVDGSTGVDGATGDDGGSTDDAGPIEDGGGMDGGLTECADDSACVTGTEYCAKPRCDAPLGGCVAAPTDCPAVVDPVCGCDGVTYGNSCEAAAARMNVASFGECASPVDGGMADAGPTGCMDNGDCAAAEYCALTVGTCGGVGSCTTRPTVCLDVIRPVCSCDGTTYGNSCEAAAAGENVASRGACDTMMCATPAPRGCCFEDADCTASAVGRARRCEGGVCDTDPGVCVSTRLAAGRCWSDDDCRGRETCMGAQLCACGVICLAPDMPGRCG